MTGMQPTRKRQAKIGLLFFASLGIPSIVFGYLALRGIQSDRAIAEQELMEDHRRAADRVMFVVERELRAIELSLSDLAHKYAEGSQPADLLLAEQIRASSRLANLSFVINDHGAIFSGLTVLYRKDNIGELLPRLVQAQKNDFMTAGEKAEFQLLNYNQARHHYERAYLQARSEKDRAEALFAAGRVLKKAGDNPGALQAFGRITREFSSVILETGFPALAAARLQLIELVIAENARNPAGELVSFYEQILQGKWDIEQSVFESLISELNNLRRQCSARRSNEDSLFEERFKEIEKRKNALVVTTEYLLELQANLQELSSQSQHSEANTGLHVQRIVRTVGNRVYNLIVIPTRNRRDGTARWLGVVLATETTGTEALASLLAQIQLPAHSALQVTNEDGQILIRGPRDESSKKVLEATFPARFPQWHLALYQESLSMFEELLVSRRRIYVYALLLAAGLAVFGGFLMLRIMTRELELAKMKSDFVSTVSHELRTPLTSIRHLSEMLRRNRVASEERRRRYYTAINEQAERLSLLIENILDISSLERGTRKLQAERVHVDEFLKRLVERAREQVQYEGFAFTIDLADDLPPVLMNQETMEQAILNLLDNAVKYSGSSKEVVIRACREDQQVLIAVKDYGLGIEESEIGRVFERFYRGTRALGHPIRGTGLGLALVQQIVAAHRGTISVQSKVGRGSTFFIRLPVTETGDSEGGEDSHHRG